MLRSSKEGIAAFERALFDSCALVRPPEKLTVSEWADKYGMLSAEGSALPGKWFTSNAEYQRGPLDILTDRRFQTVVLMWASQVGKTQIALFFTAYHMDHDPCPIIFLEPSEDMAKVIGKDRIDPMIRDTPRLGELFRNQRGRPDVLHKSFPGGQLTLAWASSASQLAMRPIRIAITDEEGRYDAAPNKEGDPIGQVRKRLATFKGARKHLRVSSPALRRTCRITKAYQDSDQRRYFVPCPQCGHMQTLRWEQLRWPAGKPAECYYVCEHAGCEIRESDKYSMILKGEWRAESPGGGDGRTAGFHLNALYSTIGYEWHEIIDEFLGCEGIPDKLQVFTNTVLAEPWDEEAAGVDMNAVQRHAEPYAAPAPAWSVVFTCGADVQPDRIEATKWGFGLNNVAGVIEHRVFHGATENAKTGAWRDFDAWRRQPIEHESGLLLPVACTFVDSGDGNRTQAVYEYCRGRESEKVFACKGSSLAGAPLVAEAKRVGRTKTLLVMVGSSTAKDLIYARLQIEDKAAAGYVHFPSAPDTGCSVEYFAGLTSEALVTRQTKGGESARWEKQRRRNEPLDCAVYAWAAKEFTRVKLPAAARALEAKAARLDPAIVAERRQHWAEQVEATARKLYDVLTTAHNLAAPVHKPAMKTHKKPRKVIRRPGFSWIHR